MTTYDQPAPDGLRTTQIHVPGANCTWCFNDAMDKVRDVDGVASVRASIIGECIEIRHHDVAMTVLVDTLRARLHGYDDSSHECQMLAVEPEPMVQTAAEPAESMETLSQAMVRLRHLGYVTEFSASSVGELICRSCGTHQAPEAITIRETVRFEGDSNPDDEAILFALSCADGCLGQYSAAFGPSTPPADVMVLQRLSRPDRDA